ncbi:MAG: hypothetical protein ACOC46_04720 [Pirellulales bacterium]
MARSIVWCCGVLALAAPQAVQAQSVAPLARYGTGLHAYFRGNDAQALESFDAAIDAGLEDPRCYYFRGLIHLRRGQTESARADFARAAELESSDAAYVHAVAMALERVQGPARLEVERYREQARATAFARLERQRRQLAARMREAQRIEALKPVPEPQPDPAIARQELLALAREYFAALTEKDRERIMAVLTPAAAETFKDIPLDVTPSEQAQYEYGEATLDGREASLPLRLTDGEIVLSGRILARFERGQWRMYGQTLAMGPNQPELLLNFEDRDALFRALAELQQGIENYDAGAAPAQPAGAEEAPAGPALPEATESPPPPAPPLPSDTNPPTPDGGAPAGPDGGSTPAPDDGGAAPPVPAPPAGPSGQRQGGAPRVPRAALGNAPPTP